MLSMERLFLSLFTLTIVFGTPSSVFADISGLVEILPLFNVDWILVSPN